MITVLKIAGVLTLLFGGLLYLVFTRDPDSALERNWDEASRTFDWGPGKVSIAPGFTHERLSGDTLIGQFNSAGSTLVIQYDIGWLAAEHGGMGPLQEWVGGSRVNLGSVRTDDGNMFWKVSFPDSGCANFSASSPDSHAENAIKFIAASFRPKTRVPSWFARLIPEMIWSDCR